MQCVRVATSKSRRKSSFGEDLQSAQYVFANAPAKYSQIIHTEGEEPKESIQKDFSSEAVKSDLSQ